MERATEMRRMCDKQKAWSANLEVHALLGLDSSDELAWDDAALMDELVEGVLSIGAWLSKVNLARLKGQPPAGEVHALAIALHGHLQPHVPIRDRPVPGSVRPSLPA